MEILLKRSNLNKILANASRLSEEAKCFIKNNRVMFLVDSEYGQYIAFLNSENVSVLDFGFSFNIKTLSETLKRKPANVQIKINNTNEISINGDIVGISPEKNSFREFSDYFGFKKFKNEHELIQALFSANKSFLHDKGAEEFINYLKLSSSHLNVFHKHFSIAKVLGESFLFEYVAIHKKILDVLVKSLNNFDEIEYIDSANILMIRIISESGAIENYFIFKANESIEFPSIRSLKVQALSSFTFDIKAFRNIIKKFKVSKTDRLVFEPCNNSIMKIYDADNHSDAFEMAYDGKFRRSVFSLKILKNFEKIIQENTDINFCIFDSASTKNGYLWFLKEPVMVYMPGITEATSEPDNANMKQ